MNYYCSVCDKTFEVKSKNIVFISLTPSQYETSVQLNHTIKNPKFSNMHKIFIDYITSHNEKFDLYQFNCEFKLDFVNLTRLIKTDFYRITTTINLKRYFFIGLNILLKRSKNFYILAN